MHQVNDDFRKFSTAEKYLEGRVNASRMSHSQISARFSRNAVFKSFGYPTNKSNLATVLDKIEERKEFKYFYIF